MKNNDYTLEKIDKEYKYSFYLKNPHIEKYFNMSDDLIKYYNNWQNEGLKEYLKNIFDFNTEINGDILEVYFDKYDKNLINLFFIRINYIEKQIYNIHKFISNFSTYNYLPNSFLSMGWTFFDNPFTSSRISSIALECTFGSISNTILIARSNF